MEASIVVGVGKGDVSNGNRHPCFSKWNLSANCFENANALTRHAIAVFIEKLTDDNEKG